MNRRTMFALLVAAMFATSVMGAASTARAEWWLAQKQGDGIQAQGQGPTREAAMEACNRDFSEKQAARNAERNRERGERGERGGGSAGGGASGRGEAMGERNANRR